MAGIELTFAARIAAYWENVSFYSQLGKKSLGKRPKSVGVVCVTSALIRHGA
jgi:hypothetical protein